MLKKTSRSSQCDIEFCLLAKVKLGFTGSFNQMKQASSSEQIQMCSGFSDLCFFSRHLPCNGKVHKRAETTQLYIYILKVISLLNCYIEDVETSNVWTATPPGFGCRQLESSFTLLTVFMMYWWQQDFISTTESSWLATQGKKNPNLNYNHGWGEHSRACSGYWGSLLHKYIKWLHDAASDNVFS